MSRSAERTQAAVVTRALRGFSFSMLHYAARRAMAYIRRQASRARARATAMPSCLAAAFRRYR